MTLWQEIKIEYQRWKKRKAYFKKLKAEHKAR